MICLPQTAAHNRFTSIIHLCYNCHKFKVCVFDMRISLVMSPSSPSIQFYELVLHQLHKQTRKLQPGIGWLDASQLESNLLQIK